MSEPAAPALAYRLPRDVYLALAFAVGFSSLVYEVYAARVLFLYFVESIHAVAITLSAFLGGLATSALVCSRWANDEPNRAHTALVALQLASAAYAVGVLRHHGLIPGAVDLSHAVLPERAGDAVRVVFSWLYLFLPGLFIGGSFPLLAGLYAGKDAGFTRATGLVYFWDTTGAIAGALAAGFLFLPWLGLSRAVLVPASLNLAVAAAVLRRPILRLVAIVAAVACATLSLIPEPPPAGAPGAPAARPSARPMAASREASSGAPFAEVIAQEPSPFGVVTVGRGGKAGSGPGLFIGQRDMCHTGSHDSESLLAEATLAQLGEGARVLNVGLGCGIVAGLIGVSPKVKALEIAEINPVVAKMAREHFADWNQGVLDLEKTTLLIQDGAELIRRSPRVYDAIVIDVEEPTIVHSSLLYTREYFEIMAGKLTPGGVLALWVIGEDPAYGRVLLNTLRAVFPEVEPRVAERHPNFTFFASKRPLSLPRPTSRAVAAISQMADLSISDVNTIDNRALERFFDIRRIFGLPANYNESVFSDAERARAAGAKAGAAAR
jgi:spermidine synthase